MGWFVVWVCSESEGEGRAQEDEEERGTRLIEGSLPALSFLRSEVLNHWQRGRGRLPRRERQERGANR